nr:ribonuclease H-like domain-containing protein [Tanacetum cinerariifolium]
MHHMSSPRLDLFKQPPCFGSTFVSEALWKSDQMHQAFEKSSLAMTHKLDDMIELPKLQPKRTYNADLECEIGMIKMPNYMTWLDDEPIGDLDTMEDKANNPSPQSTSQVLLSFKVYTLPVTHPEEVEETIEIPIEVEPLDHIKREDLGLGISAEKEVDIELHRRMKDFMPGRAMIDDAQCKRDKYMAKIPLLYRGEYSQWVERFMNYLEEQTDGEAMINSIKNGDQPLPRVTQVSIFGTSSTEQPPLKDKSMWKAAILYEYETFKATERDLLLDTYIRYLQNQGDVNDTMRSKKKTVVVTYDPLALIAEKTNVSRSKEKVVVSLDSEGSEADDFNEKKVEKKVDEKKRDMSRVKCYNCKKEGHFAKDCKKAKVKDCEYYKTKMLLTKKDKDEQVLLAEDQAWMESSSDSDQEINANIVFMAQIEKVLFDSEA